jgi:hypothetical protein
MKKTLLAASILVASSSLMALDDELTNLVDTIDGDTDVLVDTTDTITDTDLAGTTVGETIDTVDDSLTAVDGGELIDAVDSVISEPTAENITETIGDVVVANSGLIDINVDGEIVPRGSDCNIVTTDDTASITFDFGISDFGDDPVDPGEQLITFSGCDGDEVRFESSDNIADVNNPALLNITADNTTADTADDVTVALDMQAFVEGDTIENLFAQTVQLDGTNETTVEPVNVVISIVELGTRFSDAKAIGALSTETNINVIFE